MKIFDEKNLFWNTLKVKHMRKYNKFTLFHHLIKAAINHQLIHDNLFLSALHLKFMTYIRNEESPRTIKFTCQVKKFHQI